MVVPSALLFLSINIFLRQRMQHPEGIPNESRTDPEGIPKEA